MRCLRPLALFGVGGLFYIVIEIMWRGYTHWTMFIVGGLCFWIIGLVNEFVLTRGMPLVKQMLIGSVVITVVEFIAGCIINLWLGWNVWDYSNMPFNILGQVCLPFMILWFFLSALGIILDDYLRWLLWEEEKPHYRLF
ncbi:MAG: hypothetical protein PHQ72_08480 [Hespellia sp.]|nr:hypothetical protein [Hespellia sp.]